MNVRLLLPAVLTLLLTGCTTVGPLRTEAPFDNLEEVNKALTGKIARIELKSGDVIRSAPNVQVSEHITTWEAFHLRRTERIPTEEVVRVTISENKVRHFAPVIGLGVGAAAGAVSTSLVIKDCDGPSCLGQALLFPLFVAGGAAAGFLTGLIVKGETSRTAVYTQPVSRYLNPR